MSTPALRHFVERALGLHAPTFEDGFPGCFDWVQLCRDAPAIAERAGGGSEDGSERSWAKAVQKHAEATFRLAHTAALAMLCAGDAEAEDPEATLDRFSEQPDDDEEDRFEGLVSEVLGPVEESLLDDGVALDERGDRARDALDAVWPFVEAMLGEVEARREADEEASQDEVWAVLVALARVAAVLAVFRWMAAYPDASEADTAQPDAGLS